MENDPPRRQDSPAPGRGKWVPTWFLLFAIALLGLIASKLLGLEVFVEVTFDGIPFVAGLTEVKTYVIPLLLVLIYILFAWLWKKIFRSGQH